MPTSPPRARLPRFLRHLVALAATGSLGLLAGGGLAAGASPLPHLMPTPLADA